MSGFIFAAIFVAWLLFVCWTGTKAMDEERWLSKWSLACFLAVVIGLGAIINAAQSDADSGPCLREGTGLIPVGKGGLVPYTYCAERGTWTE